jgi:hypothetical protein
VQILVLATLIDMVPLPPVGADVGVIVTDVLSYPCAKSTGSLSSVCDRVPTIVEIIEIVVAPTLLLL